MKFHKRVFMAKGMSHKQEEIKHAILSKKSDFSIHVITVPPGKHQLEIFPIGLNTQPGFNVENHLVVGVADTYSESLELIKRLSEVVYEELGVLDFRAYFK